MLGGTHGKILHIDLATGETRVEQPPEEVYRLLSGGRALTAYLLLRDLPPNIDPLGPENLLIFAPGILQGTAFPGAGRHGVGAKSPLTGGLASSEAGGWWGHEFKRTGYDALVVHGQAEAPVYVWIHNDEVDIRPAEHLWGLKTGPTEATIRQELDNDRARIAQIGPGGENKVLYAAVMHDVNRAAGRNGLGAVMGAKNLKAVAVRGTTKVPVVDRARVTKITRWFGETYKDLMAWGTVDIGRGTQDGVMNLAPTGGLPTLNFGKAEFEDAELLSGERNYEMFLKGRDTCMGCPVSCKQVFENVDEDPNRNLDPVYGGAEYEAMGAMGSACGVTDNLAVLKANELSNAYGLDCISAGMVVAFVMECYENGLISKEDTGGLDFSWGNAETLVKSINLIAKREGFGDLMADGVARMAKQFGPESEPFNITVKGQELPMHEPRLKHALGVGYAVAPVGADHMMNIHDTMYTSDNRSMNRVNSALEDPVPPTPRDALDENKLKIFLNEVNWAHANDCALICAFYSYDYGQLAEALSGVTGTEYGIQDVLDLGARAQTLSRLFNLREGLTTADDKLPNRVMTAFEEGPIAGSGISDEDFGRFLHRFYEEMGWDADTGVPTEEELAKLGLDSLL